MTQTTTDTAALALKLASAQKKCPCFEKPQCETCCASPEGHQSPYDGPNMDVLLYECRTCDGTGEVYVLGPEVRMECEGYNCWHGKYLRGVNTKTREPILGDNCKECNGRGWVALDPRYGWDWMVALAKAGKFIPVTQFSGLSWEAKGYNGRQMGYYFADTPGPAFQQAAIYALGLELDKTVDTPSP